MASKQDSVRYGVVGLGYFAQAAILPAFARADNSELVAIFSEDSGKLKALGDQYDVPKRLPYDAYEECLSSRQLDAVYIALPNSLHAQYAIAAAKQRVHVLCEKPMAVTEQECLDMLDAARKAGVKLMVGYRLHFEPANLSAIEAVCRGDIGDPRIFNSVFTMQVHSGNTRLRADLGGGPLYDIGIYCINAARYIFRDEPISVCALAGQRADDDRFREVDEQVAAILRFSGGRVATFVASFGASDVSRYQVVGTQGTLQLEPAYEYAEPLHLEVHSERGHTQRTFDKGDQIASELIYFSNCIRNDEHPEPSGSEGLADVRIIRALLKSDAMGHAVELDPIERMRRPDGGQAIHVPPHGMPQLVHARPPSR